jgi:hypothetical protein
MSRSEEVRLAALERDGYRCQICGRDVKEQLEVHHIRPLGMGGSEERDTLDNMITLCADCHRDIHNNRLTIVKGYDDLEVVDQEGRKVDHDHIWYYRRAFAEELEKVEARVMGLQLIDNAVAHDIWRLWKDNAWKYLDPDARSWKEYCASRSWGVSRATRLAKMVEKGLELDIEWSDGETESDYKRKLPYKPQAYFYLRLLSGGGHEWHRTANEDELRDKMEFGDILIKVGKTVWGIRSEKGKLIDPEGNRMQVISDDSTQ